MLVHMCECGVGTAELAPPRGAARTGKMCERALGSPKPSGNMSHFMSAGEQASLLSRPLDPQTLLWVGAAVLGAR